MQRSRIFQPTFRLKLLVALIATIAPLLLVTLLVVRREADRQVDAIVQSTANRASDAFARIENLRQQQLDQLGYRAAESNRWGAALQQALEGDTAFLVETTRYELGLAGYPGALAGFANLSGDPVAAVVDGVALKAPAAAISKPAIDSIFAGDTAVFGYHLLNGHLYSIHPTILHLVTEPIGIVQLGFAIDHETARSLGGALGAEVCFEAGGQCVASSWEAGGARLHAKRFASISRPLGKLADTNAQIVLRIPLDDVVRPFTAIQKAIRYAGIAVLLLAIIVALLLSRSLAQPVKALVAATERVARGDYEAHVSVESKDELGALATAFNHMTDGLLLKEKYRGVLDKVVSRDVADEMLKGEIQLGGELRQVTTLFADVRGFTAMSEGMPPHDVIALLNEVMERAEDAVVAEGGVVDKYVGDEIMALFGAPLAGSDDPMRAIRAALRIQTEVGEINRARAVEGKNPVLLGIGINTGNVVAGNMGSARRLNYTVIGAPVNLAGRLCSEAEGGQILISEGTLAHVHGNIEALSLGKRVIKGLSRPIEIFEVLSLVQEKVPAVSRALVVLCCIMLGHAAAASAQRTIDVGPLQIQPSARIDLLGFAPQQQPAWMVSDSSAFLATRSSAYFDIFAGRHLYSLVELRADRGETPSSGNLQVRVEQAFVRWTPFTKSDASLQVGRFVSPFGNYPQRHHSSSDPLIRPPLAYDYRTMICGEIVAPTRDDFIDWKDAPSFWRPIGLPPIWAAPYQLGAMLIGSYKRASYRLALMNGAPSAEPNVWNYLPKRFSDMSYVANVGMQITPELRVGASYSDGPYMAPGIDSVLPAGKTSADYYQRLMGIEASATRGFLELRGEYLHDIWEVPNVEGEDAIDDSWYIESKVKLGVGAFVSARLNGIHFNELTYQNGTHSPWDYDVHRLQLGAGYRVSQPLELRAEWMLNRTAGPADPKDNLFVVQASWVLN